LTHAELVAEVNSAVAALRDQFYANDGDAFAHYAIKSFFDVDDDDAFEFCDIGGRNDKGIDAFWNDESERRIAIVQVKYSAAGDASYDRDVILNLEGAHSWLSALGRGRKAAVNDQVAAAAETVKSLRDNDPEYPVELYCIAFGRFTPAAIDEADRFNEDHDGDGVRLTLVPAEGLRLRVEELDSREADGPHDAVELHLHKWFDFAPDESTPHAFVGNIEGAELAALERRFQYRIFQRNVRYYLKATQKVNEQMAETIQTAEGRNRFWFYNNGVAIVCDKIERVDEHGDVLTLRIENLQIVNGCQTTTTLGAYADDLEQAAEPVFILARIIEAPSDDLQRSITLYNNRQNAVRDRDLLSNDGLQDRLQKEFNDLDPPWFYERKRGEWDAVVAKRARLRAKFGRPARRVDNEKAAQAAYAFFKSPADARARKRLLFVPNREGGFYDDVFNEETTAERLLLPYRLAERIAKKKSEYLREIKTIDPLKPSAREKRQLEREWIKFGDQFILGAMSFYIQQRVPLAQDELADLLGPEFDGMFDGLYPVATRQLNRFFRGKRSEYVRRNEPWVPANFVKTNWTEVENDLEDEWEMRLEQGDDPLAPVPLLSERSPLE
jgi:hypothetical protein